jgi:hypothetical protein
MLPSPTSTVEPPTLTATVRPPRLSADASSWLGRPMQTPWSICQAKVPPNAVRVNTSAMTKGQAIYQAERNARFTSAIRFSSRL